MHNESRMLSGITDKAKKAGIACRTTNKIKKKEKNGSNLK